MHLSEHYNAGHDAFFKTAFRYQEVAIEYIQRFLPSEIVQDLDFSGLTLDSNDYLTPDMKPFLSDVVWKCPLGNSSQKLSISFLFEHKSRKPKCPYLQLLRYMLEIWEKQFRDKTPLMPVIPIIVYHNKQKRKWIYRPFQSCFSGINDVYLKYLPEFEYQLTDLTRFSEDMILEMKKSLLGKTLMTLQFGVNDEFVIRNLPLLLAEAGENDYLKNFIISQFVYITKNTEIDKQKLTNMIRNLPKSAKKTTFDLIIEEGYEKGLEEGIEKGIEKGLAKGELMGEERALRKTIENLILKTKFDDQTIADITDADMKLIADVRISLPPKKA